MAYLAVIFFICVGTQFATLSSAYRMDKYLKDIKFFPRKNIPSQIKKYFIFFNKLDRDNFLIYGILIHYYFYFTMASAIVLMIASLIMWNDNMTFITAVIYFCFMALDVLLLCFELIMLTFFDKKTYGDD